MLDGGGRRRGEGVRKARGRGRRGGNASARMRPAPMEGGHVRGAYRGDTYAAPVEGARTRPLL